MDTLLLQQRRLVRIEHMYDWKFPGDIFSE